jgi:L-serine dehydratase
MLASVVDLFSIGVGPSSSHTVGPMRAAARFAAGLGDAPVAAVRCTLYGSLAATGPGHGTPGAIRAGLEGADPATVDPARVLELAARPSAVLRLPGGREVTLDDDEIELRRGETVDGHPNALDLVALDATGNELARRRYFSVGGGFVREEGESDPGGPDSDGDTTVLPHPVDSADDLLERCGSSDLTVAGLVEANEREVHGDAAATHLREAWRVMSECIAAGLSTEGELPGGLAVQRRAPALAEGLREGTDPSTESMEWLGAVAMAVNEENAAGGRVVTAPTNGAAGIIPAVLHWALHHARHRLAEPERTDDELAVRFLYAAGGIGALIKERASISGADLGCQGEVGSACAMAAAGLAELVGGTPEQVENAAEIAIEHNLGLTCDPVGGLVQIPCIERNAVAAVKAVTAVTLAMSGTGEHHVSLDQAVETMRQTGMDMLDKYKETSTGGLAVNVPEC